MKKNISYIIKNLSKTFSIKFDVIPQGTVSAIVFPIGNINEEHLNSDMQIYCAKFGYTWTGLKNDCSRKYFAIFSF